MGLGMTRIEDDHHLLAWADKLACASHHFSVGRISLNERNIRSELVAFDSLALLRADFDVDSDHATLAGHGLEQRSTEDQRAAVRYSCLDDDIGTQCEDHLLQPHQILRMLDDRAAEPCESVGIFLVPTGL